MRKCPTCGRVYEDGAQVYCLNDGAMLFDANRNSEPTARQLGSLPKPYASSPPLAKKRNYLLIFGGIGLLLFLLFGGVILIAGLIISFKNQNNSVNNANNNASPKPVSLTADRYSPELRVAISGANQAEATALATQNAGGLEKYFSGEALKAATTTVDQLKKLKMIHVGVIQNQDFEYFKVNEAETEAEVRVVETWEVTALRAADAKCLGYYPPTRLPQVIYLKKAQSGWMIDAVVYDKTVNRKPQPCPKKK